MKVKKIICLLLTITMVFATVSFAASEDTQMYSEDCKVEELKHLVTMLADNSLITRGRGVDFRAYENLHLHPEFRECMYDARTALLTEFHLLLMEAVRTQEKARGIDSPYPRTIMAFTSHPDGIYRETFLIAFTDEAYLELVDLIVEFTGIETEMFEIIICEPLRFSPSVGQPMEVNIPLATFDDGYIPIEPTFVGVLPMGTPLMFRFPNNPQFFGFGTLGHPRDNTGRVAFGTNHGVVPNGASVYLHSAERIGTVTHVAFYPSQGIDVSVITFNPGVSVSRFTPGTNRQINTFSARPTLTDNLTMHASLSGNAQGRATNLSYNVEMSGHFMINMLLTNIGGVGEDSGAALTSIVGTPGTARVHGTLVGGSRVRTAFSHVARYFHLG